MQRARALGSFPEPFDLNEGSLPSNNSMDHSSSWDNSPVENRTDGWNNGGSSPITHNVHEEALGHHSDSRNVWSSAFHPYSATSPMSEGWSFQPSNISNSSYAGNQVATRSPTMETFASNWTSHNIDSSDRDMTPTNYYPSSNRGKYSGASSSPFESTNLPSSSSSWGPSYKRKALEGTSGQFYQGGSSSSNHMTDNFLQHNPFASYAPSPHLSINMSSNPEQINSRSGFGMSGVPPPRIFPSSTNSRLAEGSGGHPNVAPSNGYHDPFQFDTLRGTSVGQPIVSGRLSRPISNNEIPSTVTSQAHLARFNEPREVHAYPWRGPVSSGGRSSNSLMEVNEGSFLRNNLEHSRNAASPETRIISRDHIDWSFPSITPAPVRSRPYGSRIGSSAGGRPSSSSSSSPAMPYHSRALQDHQRLLEASQLPYQPWMESESGTQSSHFESSSSAEAAVSSRQRLNQQIRHVLRAMSNGGVHLPPELGEYVLIDPFMEGFVELHDQHREMRLDVDNMSYEELLALGEQIGDVNTGVSEAKIWGSMKQRRHEVLRASPNLEPCCICQENYVSGDDIGVLDCAHEFHSGCITQWLKLKNLCPICKMTALKT